MKILLYLLRFILGGIFIFSALTKLFPIEVFELNFVYQGITGWEGAPYLSRALIIIELFLGIALFFRYRQKEFILPATFFLLIAFSVYLIYSIAKDGNAGNCACFGTVLPMTPLESLIKNVLLLLIVVFLYVKTETKISSMKWLHPSIFVMVSAAIVLLFPIYDYSFEESSTKNEQADVVSLSGFKGDEKVDLSKGKKLVAIFNMACDHCIEVALKLSAVKSRVELPPSYYVLLGDSSEVKEFYSLTNSNAPYVLMQTSDFIKQFKSGWPRVFLLQDGRIKYDNNRRTFNGGDFEKAALEFLN